MKITFLGTGTSQGVPMIACQCDVCKSKDTKDKRLRTSVLVQYKNTNIVVDSGPDFRQQMIREDVRTLDAILFTHEHKDHIAGTDDIRAYNHFTQKPLDLYADDRVQKAMKREFAYAFAKEKYPGIPEMNMIDLPATPFVVKDIEVIPIKIMHLKLPIHAYRFDKIAYITDANYISPEEKDKLNGVELLVVNALRKQKHISHFCLSEALELIDEIKPQQAFLTHMSHQMGLHEKVQADLPPYVFLAYDGLQVSV